MFNTRSWQPTAEVSDWLKERGFKREATVGTSAAISEITQRACICPPESRSTIVIVSGNSDLFTCIESVLKQDGWNVEVHSWKHQTLPKVLENLHCKTNLLVNYLDQYLARITYIKYNGDFKFKNDVPHNFKQVVLHMTPDPYRDHYKWCKALEDVIRWPFQYHFQIGKTAETDDLVLTFHTDGNGEHPLTLCRPLVMVTVRNQVSCVTPLGRVEIMGNIILKLEIPIILNVGDTCQILVKIVHQ